MLLEQGVKLFELPLAVYRPGPDGFFDQPYFETSIGLACAGSTLVFQQVYATMVPVLSKLGGAGEVPMLADVASFVGRLTTSYVRALGATRPHSAMANLTVAGACPSTGSLEAYELSASLDPDGMWQFVPSPVNLADDRVHFAGDQVAVEKAQRLLISYRESPVPGAPYHRAALNTIRDLIESDDSSSVGGDVQMAFTIGHRMRRVATTTPVKRGAPEAQTKLNNMSLDAMGEVGPCFPILVSMACP